MRRTPQWRVRILSLIGACLMIVTFSAQTWLILTHRVSAALVYGVEGIIGMVFGALIILLALARTRRWPLPRSLRGPDVAAYYAGRLAYAGVLVFVLGACMARSIIPFW